MNDCHDFIIIGSGAGGSVMARELCTQGAKVLLLEAGSHYRGSDYPRNEMLSAAKLMWGGGAEMSADASTILLRGKAVGGGTVVNQALLDRFDDIAWRDFKAESGVSFFTSEAMDPHYDAVEAQLALHTFDDRQEWNRNAVLYVEALEKLGYQWQPLRRAQAGCDGHDCIVCLGGCPRDAKQSMNVTFLQAACNDGLRIVADVLVGEIVEGKDCVAVHARQHGQSRVFYARRCILSAGALGTSELLLRSGYARRLPALGKYFYCHPQWMSTAMCDEIVDAHKGSFQAAKSADPRLRDWRFKLENVFAGPMSIAMLNHHHLGREHQQYMADYRRMMCIEVSLREQTPGEITLTKHGRLSVKKTLNHADLARAAKGRELVHELFLAAGAKNIMHSDIRIGLHLMGGARLGQNAGDSVVDEGFRLHGSDKLYVADGALFANAPGINPSLSIMALAHRAARTIIDNLPR
ncbi:MAG: GMC family oxidoreductase [Neisseria sp.]|nr:GMC family oxidoreductase [Neisseria sp.]